MLFTLLKNAFIYCVMQLFSNSRNIWRAGEPIGNHYFWTQCKAVVVCLLSGIWPTCQLIAVILYIFFSIGRASSARQYVYRSMLDIRLKFSKKNVTLWRYFARSRTNSRFILNAIPGFIGHLLASKALIPFNKLTNCFLIIYPLITRIILLSSDGSIHLSIGLIVSMNNSEITALEPWRFVSAPLIRFNSIWPLNSLSIDDDVSGLCDHYDFL